MVRKRVHKRVMEGLVGGGVSYVSDLMMSLCNGSGPGILPRIPEFFTGLFVFHSTAV